jgi:hypothetical protein
MNRPPANATPMAAKASTLQVLARRAIAIVANQPLLRRLALRLVLRFPALLLRFKSHIKDALVLHDADGAASVSIPPLAGDTTVLGPRFKNMILEEIQGLNHVVHEENRRCD